MAVEILAKPMPIFRTERDITPSTNKITPESIVASVWTPVRLDLVMPSGIARWRVVGGLYDGYIMYVTKTDTDIFMVPSLQGMTDVHRSY